MRADSQNPTRSRALDRDPPDRVTTMDGVATDVVGLHSGETRANNDTMALSTGHAIFGDRMRLDQQPDTDLSIDQDRSGGGSACQMRDITGGRSRSIT